MEKWKKHDWSPFKKNKAADQAFSRVEDVSDDKKNKIALIRAKRQQRLNRQKNKDPEE